MDKNQKLYVTQTKNTHINMKVLRETLYVRSVQFRKTLSSSSLCVTLISIQWSASTPPSAPIPRSPVSWSDVWLHLKFNSVGGLTIFCRCCWFHLHLCLLESCSQSFFYIWGLPVASPILRGAFVGAILPATLLLLKKDVPGESIPCPQRPVTPLLNAIYIAHGNSCGHLSRKLQSRTFRQSVKALQNFERNLVFTVPLTGLIV